MSIVIIVYKYIMDSKPNQEQVLTFMQITECQDYAKAESYLQMAGN